MEKQENLLKWTVGAYYFYVLIVRVNKFSFTALKV